MFKKVFVFLTFPNDESQPCIGSLSRFTYGVCVWPPSRVKYPQVQITFLCRDASLLSAPSYTGKMMPQTKHKTLH